MTGPSAKIFCETRLVYPSSKMKVDTARCLNQYCAHPFPVRSLNSLLVREWLFSKGAPIVHFNLCPTVH